MPARLPICLILAAALLAACATAPPLDLSGVDRGLRPDLAVTEFERYRGQRVVWGGVIISSKNLETVTEIEILAFPIDANSLWPDTSEPARGRFLLRRTGYLETLDYAPGRYLTAVGTVTEIRQVDVGESRIDYPVVAVSQLHLFRQQPQASEPRVRFGFGLILHN